MIGFTSLAVFLFSALALVVGGGYSIGASLLFVASAALLWKRPALSLTRADSALIGVLLLYFAVLSAITLFHGDPGREYDAPLRFLLVVPVLLLLLAYPARPAALWAGLAIGALGGASFATWQHLVLGLPRAAGSTTNAIQFGNVSMLLGILCMSGIGWALTQRHRVAWTVLMLLGAAAGIFGSLLSGSRGGWIAMPLCAFLLCVHCASVHGRRFLYAGLLGLALLLLAAYTVPSSPVKSRTLATLQEAHAFSSVGKVDTSLGQRLEMWRTAIVMAPERPLLGWGKQGYMARKLAMIAEGKFNADIGEYTNVHNEYLDALVKHGLVGMLAVLALFLLPLLLFARQLKNPRRDVHPYALAGVSLGICYMIFGLTTTFLTLNIGVMMLAFMTAILWSGLRAADRSPAPPPPPRPQS